MTRKTDDHKLTPGLELMAVTIRQQLDEVLDLQRDVTSAYLAASPASSVSELGMSIRIAQFERLLEAFRTLVLTTKQDVRTVAVAAVLTGNIPPARVAELLGTHERVVVDWVREYKAGTERMEKV